MARGVTFAVLACALGWLMLFDPWAPFSREVGVCEAGAVRDVLAGNFILPSYDPQARFRPHYQPRMPREREWGPGGMVQAPPLYWWLSAFTVPLLGLNEFALRMPSILAGAAVCAVLYALGNSGVRQTDRGVGGGACSVVQVLRRERVIAADGHAVRTFRCRRLPVSRACKRPKRPRAVHNVGWRRSLYRLGHDEQGSCWHVVARPRACGVFSTTRTFA